MELSIVTVVLIGSQLLALSLAALLIYHTVKQQGRILIQLERLTEQASGELGIPQFDPQGTVEPDRGPRLQPGEPVPGFQLPDLDGQLKSLEDFKGTKVLLINWSPGCSFCDLIAPDLAASDKRLREKKVQTVLVASSGVEENRKLVEAHGLEALVLMDQGVRSAEIFRNQGTPVAALIDEQGHLTRPLVVGSDAVVKLALELADGKSAPPLRKQPVNNSRIARDGLSAGTVAPAFTLNGIDGRRLALEDVRGKQVLLVFSDPHCGPCDRLASHLELIHVQCRQRNAAVVVIGRGDAEENRKKARKFGLSCPVLLQNKWEVSKQYAIFLTPVAYWIDEEGVIARDVAKGVDEVLQLADTMLAASGKEADRVHAI